MLAWREVRNIAMNTPAKYVEIKRLLRLHDSDQIILYRIADQPSFQRSLQACLRIASIALF
jgi:hypothetical protein